MYQMFIYNIIFRFLYYVDKDDEIDDDDETFIFSFKHFLI